MTLGSPTSPKPTSGAQFLPGFLMGDLPAPATQQPRSFSLTTPIAETASASRGQLDENEKCACLICFSVACFVYQNIVFQEEGVQEVLP